jgi:hypothetical protein
MAVKTDAATAAKNWSDRFAAAGTKATAGANSVTVSPGMAAAKQANVWASNVAASLDKFRRKVGAVTVDQWRNAYITVGVPRFSSGATKGAPKMQQFMSAFLPVLTNAVGSLPPRGSYEQNKARAVALMDKLHGFTYTPGPGQ